jgi:hypothetical protein
VFGRRHIAVLNGTRRTSTHSAARTDRTEFLDVTDAANPRLLWTFGPDQVDRSGQPRRRVRAVEFEQRDRDRSSRGR